MNELEFDGMKVEYQANEVFEDVKVDWVAKVVINYGEFDNKLENEENQVWWKLKEEMKKVNIIDIPQIQWKIN